MTQDYKPTRRQRRPWTKEDQSTAERLRAEGWSYGRIGQRLDRDKSVIAGRLSSVQTRRREEARENPGRGLSTTASTRSSLPPLEKLQEFFAYDPELGKIVWARERGPAKAGSIAGSLVNEESRERLRLIVRFNGRSFDAARIAWLFIHKEDPGRSSIYCANGNPLDLRKENLVKLRYPLEHASRKDGAHRGVSLRKHPASHRKPWASYIIIKDKQYSLGYYATQEEAIKARLHAEGLVEEWGDEEAAREIKQMRAESKRKAVSGIYFRSNRQRWCVWVAVGNKRQRVGSYRTEEEAVAARKRAEVEFFAEEVAS